VKKDMFRFHVVFLLALALVIFTAFTEGCSKTPETATGADDKPASMEIFNMGTHPVGTLFNAIGSGLATVISEETPYEIRVIAASGPVEWFPSFVSREIDIGVLNSWDAMMGWQGRYDYEVISKGEGFPVRLLTVGCPTMISGIVAEDSGIKTAKDIVGKRFVNNFTGSAGITAQAKAFLANHNISESDIKGISVPSVADGVYAVMEGRADASCCAVTGMGAVEELDATRGARFLSFDPSPDAVQRMQQEFPGYLVKVEPGPTGVREAIYAMAYDIVLVARTDLPENVAYTLVKALWENYEQLAPIHPLLKKWTADRFVSEMATVPYHPGAVKFYKEQGAWNDAMEKLQSELLKAEK